jgi:hypothetical protein
MADLPPRRPLGTLPAHGLLAPGAHNLEIGLLGYDRPRLTDQLLGRGNEYAGVADQLATLLYLDTTDRARYERWHAVKTS